MIIELLKLAIQNQIPIEFEYAKEGKVKGRRMGYPHVLYYVNNTRHMLVDFYQIEGVSDSLEEGATLPDWHSFDINHMIEVVLLNKQSPFDIASDYQPYSERYLNVVVKI